MLIGEVSEQSGISARMLRHYDRIGLVSPSERTPSGYRRYSAEDVRRLFHVEGLRSLGLSLREIAEVLDGVSFDPTSMVDQLIAGTRDRLAQERELLRRLGQVRESEPTAWSDVLHTIGLMRGFDATSPSARQRLALSLTEDDDRDAALLAEAALNEADPHVAGALRWALARIGDGAIPTLAEALLSPVRDRRHRAVDTLVKIDSPRARAVLSEAFQHPDPRVRARATLTRGGQGDRDALPELVALIVGGHYDVEAADTLGTLATAHGHADEIAEAIADALDIAPGTARLRLVAALADVPGHRAAETLVAALDDPDRRVALTASSVLRSRPPEEHGTT